jgi:hypothetical protein
MELMYICKNNILEKFGMGNKTVNNIKYDASASFESNDRVNTSMMVDALVSIINSAVNDVKQSNSAEAAALASASNVLSLNGITGKNLVIKNVVQNANADVTANIELAQKNVSTIINTMETSIVKNITKQSDVSNVINEINRSNETTLQAALDKIPSVPQVKKPTAGDIVNNFFGSGNTTKNNIKVEFETDIKKMLEIDDSFKISDDSNINNELVNTIGSTNYSNCEAEAAIANALALTNVNVDNIIIDTISQTGKADLNLNCTFNQSNVSKLANKIVSQISSTVNNLYKGIEGKPDPSKYELLHHLGASLSDKIIGAGGKVPNNDGAVISPAPGTIGAGLGTSSEVAPVAPPVVAPVVETPAAPVAEPEKNSNNQSNKISNTTLYIIIGIVSFIILLLILLIFI